MIRASSLSSIMTFPRRWRSRRCTRPAAVRDARQAALAARGLARRPDAIPALSQGPLLPRLRGAPGRARSPGHHARRDRHRTHPCAQPTRGAWPTGSRPTRAPCAALTSRASHNPSSSPSSSLSRRRPRRRPRPRPSDWRLETETETVTVTRTRTITRTGGLGWEAMGAKGMASPREQGRDDLGSQLATCATTPWVVASGRGRVAGHACRPRRRAPRQSRRRRRPWRKGAPRSPTRRRRGDAAVVLELVVEIDGAISSVAVVDGADPLPSRPTAAAALAVHARDRGDTPVAARIRARVDFHQDRPQPARITPAPPPPAAGRLRQQPSPPPEPALDVTVRGRRREIGQTTLSDADVREMPGAFGDPFRAIEALPGVTPMVSGLPYFYHPRRAAEQQRLLRRRGSRSAAVPPRHRRKASSTRASSITSTSFPAPRRPLRRRGGRDHRGPDARARPRPLHGEANLRLVDAGGLVEAPFGRRPRQRARRRALRLSRARSSARSPPSSISATGTTRRGRPGASRERDVVGIFVFGSHDYLATPSPSGDPTARPNRAVRLRLSPRRPALDHPRSPTGACASRVTGGHDWRGAAPTYITDRSGAARLEASAGCRLVADSRAAPARTLDAYGFRRTRQGRVEPAVPSTARSSAHERHGGRYADVVWRIGAARRADARRALRRVLVVARRRPGAATQVRTTRAGVRSAAVGARRDRAASPGSRRWAGAPVPGVARRRVPGGDGLCARFPVRRQRFKPPLQASQGLEVAAGGRRAHGDRLPVALVGPDRPDDDVLGDGRAQPPAATALLSEQPAGRAARPTVSSCSRGGRCPGASAAGSRTRCRARREQARFITPAGARLATVPSEVDRTHVLNAVLAFELGRRWRLGARFLFYTGALLAARRGAPVPPYNGYRDPAFFRLDLRVEKRWALGKSGSVALVVEGQNVTLSTEMTAGRGLHRASGRPDTVHRADESGPSPSPASASRRFSDR